MESLEQTLRRLDDERGEADRRYNDALTALDRALPAPGGWPAPHPAQDDSQLAALNAAWDIAAIAPAAQAGWRGRLAGFIWRTVAPYLQQQGAFNSRLVDHLNRHATAARYAHQRAEETAARLREESARLAEFHARVVQYLQQVTAYIDTRDRRSAGGALVLNASLSGLAENMDKRWESLSVRDQRADARASAIAASQNELRALLAVVQQASLSLKRELEKILSVQGGQERLRPERGAESPRESERGGAPRAVRKADRTFRFLLPRCLGLSTATSTSGSRISFAGRVKPSVRGSRATSRSLSDWGPTPPTSSISDAGAASFSSSLPAPASVPEAST